MKPQNNSTPEQIKPIEGYEGEYSISNFGYVISHYKNGKNKILKPGISNGYPFVILSNSRGKNMPKGTRSFTLHKIHKLIIRNFKQGKKLEDCVNHIDGNKMNNNVDNLEACTQKYNVHEAIRLNRKPNMYESCKNKRSVIVYDPIDDITYTVESMYKLAKYLGVKVCAIYNACNGHQKTCKGLFISYAD